MQILFLTQILPYPLDAGPKIRAYYVLRHLAQNNQITLVSFVRDTDTPEAIAHLEQYCDSVHTVPMPRSPLLDVMHLGRSLLTGQSFLMARDWVAEMANLIAELMRGYTHFDAVNADQLSMAPYAQWARDAAVAAPSKAGPTANGQPPSDLPREQPRIILDQHNAVFMIPKRLGADERNPLKRGLFALESRKMARFEVETCVDFDAVTWVTQEDYDAVQAVGDLTLQDVPNSGIIPICGDAETKAALGRCERPHRVTFLGGLHYPPNAQGICWYAEHAFPKVLADYPDAVLTVIGKQPPGELHQMGIPSKNLEVTGFVDDPLPYLTETAAFVVPLKAGGGMRVKILDAWMWELPIVSTTIGAEGIEIEPEKNMLIADAPDDLAAATLRLLQAPDVANQIAHSGRAWAEKHYNWRTVYKKWDQIYL